MKNIDIVEWMINNGFDPMECMLNIKTLERVFVADVLEKHLLDQLKAIMDGDKDEKNH